MPAEGGPARRLTWLGPDVQVRGWTAEGEILFVTTYGQPFFRNYRAFTVSPRGGLPQVLPFGQVNHLALTARGLAGPKVIGRNTADPARWKRYRGGTAGHLWVDAAGSGEFTRLPLAGNITSPMWLNERIHFLSDAEGIGNLYSCRADGSDLRRHTDHADFYARHAQTDGRRIVYQCGAQLWLFDPAIDRTKCVDVRVPAHRAQAARRFCAAADHLGDVALHPRGHSVVLDARGKCFSLPLWEGAVRQHGSADGARHRHAQWLGDGQQLVVVSDASGEERIEVHGEGAPRALPWDIGRVIALQAAPVGERIAIANHRNEVLIGDLAGGSIAVIDRSESARTESVAWSPDGAWLAYPFWTSSRHCAIKLYEIATGRATLVTTPEFRDYAPAFDPAGRYLYFLSVRTFDPVYDNVQFELSFPRAARPYLIALQADAPPPFEPPLRGMKPGGDDKKDADTPEKKPLRVDLDGIVRRVAAFPVVEGLYGQIAGVAAGRGKVFWTLFDIPGAHGRGGHKDGPGRLEAFDFDTGRAEPVMDKVDRFVVAADGSTLLAVSGKRLRALDPHKGVEKNGNGAGDESPSRKSGWLDLARIRVSVEPRREWQQMLREVWRLQRDQFWVPDMSGVDWSAVYARYAPLAERVATMHRGRGRPAGVARLPPQALLLQQAGAKVALTLAPPLDQAAEARRHPRGAGDHAGRRDPGALPRVGRAQPRLGARGQRWTRRLLPRAGHDECRLCRVPPLLRHRVRPRRIDRRRALQPRRACLAVAAGKGGAPTHRLERAALGPAQLLPRRSTRRRRGGADQRAGRVGRRHLQPRLQADGHRHTGGRAHLGRRDRHLAAPQAGGRQRDHAARVRLLVCRRGLGRWRTSAPSRRWWWTTRRRTHDHGDPGQMHSRPAEGGAYHGENREPDRQRLPDPLQPLAPARGAQIQLTHLLRQGIDLTAVDLFFQDRSASAIGGHPDRRIGQRVGHQRRCRRYR
jgi:tricorn protease-like protein